MYFSVLHVDPNIDSVYTRPQLILRYIDMEEYQVIELLALNPYSSDILIDPRRATFLENLENEILIAAHSFSQDSSDLLLILIQKNGNKFQDISMRRLPKTKAKDFMITSKNTPVIMTDHSLIFSRDLSFDIETF